MKRMVTCLLALLAIFLCLDGIAEERIEYELQDKIAFGMSEKEVLATYNAKYDTTWQQVKDGRINGVFFFTEWLGEKDIIPSFQFSDDELIAVKYTVFGKNANEKGNDFDNVSQYLHDVYGKPTTWRLYNKDGTDPNKAILRGTYSWDNLVSAQEWLFANIRIGHYMGTFLDKHLYHAVSFSRSPIIWNAEEYFFLNYLKK